MHQNSGFSLSDFQLILAPENIIDSSDASFLQVAEPSLRGSTPQPVVLSADSVLPASVTNFAQLDADDDAVLLQADADDEATLSGLSAKQDAAAEFQATTAQLELENELDIKRDELNSVQEQIADLESELNTPKTCADYGFCSSCTLNSACVWCPAENLCVDGTAAGPQEGSCDNFEYGQCASLDCDEFFSCAECVNNPGCGWCEGTQLCYEGGDNTGECENEQFYYAYAESNNVCPGGNRDYIIIYSTEDQQRDQLRELQERRADLLSDIERIQGQIQDLNNLAEAYPGFLGV
jgi:hypothetical protein